MHSRPNLLLRDVETLTRPTHHHPHLPTPDHPESSPTPTNTLRMENKPAALIIGISGCSSSGKTTLARLLHDIFPSGTFVLHQDDFYRPENE